MPCSRFSPMITSVEICKLNDPLQSSYFDEDNLEVHWCLSPLKQTCCEIPPDSRINRNWCQQYKEHLTRHPGAMMRSTMETSKGRLTQDWWNNCTRRQGNIKRNVALHITKLFVEKGIGKKLPTWERALCQHASSDSPYNQKQEEKEMPKLIHAKMVGII